jgi:hypothetical protein
VAAFDPPAAIPRPEPKLSRDVAPTIVHPQSPSAGKAPLLSSGGPNGQLPNLLPGIRHPPLWRVSIIVISRRADPARIADIGHPVEGGHVSWGKALTRVKREIDRLLSAVALKVLFGKRTNDSLSDLGRRTLPYHRHITKTGPGG